MQQVSVNFFGMWHAVRLSAVALIPGFLVDVEIIFLVVGFSFVHAKSGLESIIADYVHDQYTQLLFLILLRVCFLKIIFCTIEFFL
jgi:succinate dehydrogenase hydrophobic anchor subunit|uniref:Succinate:cytochrome c oxidoreductase subunit 4 n=1 Tax=Palmaria decipiens TaxID=187399 RepID=A0A6C0W1V2_PALDE|nr:succinate:cytochrome c oxidoreductase subunit 4 [Palmaria decipiens]QIC19661.1 succinate:cytochrome c oxidoreductase subunit 4 [Palmaria decipiens]